MLAELRRLNFAELIHVDHPHIEKYTYSECKDNGKEHLLKNKYCIDCENNDWATQKAGYASARLTGISHGAHSSDFFLAPDLDKIDRSKWHNAPIMFVFENPVYGPADGKGVTYGQHKKFPSPQWYWIYKNTYCPHNSPHDLSAKKYQDFLVNIMHIFELENVYMTNMVKCSLTPDTGKNQFHRLEAYKEACINNCIDTYLKREIDYIQPIIIFSMSAAVDSKIKERITHKCDIVQLPHPARRYFPNKYFRHIYFWVIAEALYKQNIIDDHKVKKLAMTFFQPVNQPTVSL